MKYLSRNFIIIAFIFFSSSPVLLAMYDDHTKELKKYLVAHIGDYSQGNKRHRCDMIKYHIEQGADPNIIGDDSTSAFHIIALLDGFDVIDTIVQHGGNNIDVMTNPNNGNIWAAVTPLMWAAFLGNVNVIKKLIDHGAKIEVMNVFGKTALMRAIQKNQVNAVIELLLRGANIESRIHSKIDGATPLMLSKEPEMADTLICLGANIQAISSEGKTAVDLLKGDTKKLLMSFWGKKRVILSNDEVSPETHVNDLLDHIIENRDIWQLNWFLKMIALPGENALHIIVSLRHNKFLEWAIAYYDSIGDLKTLINEPNSYGHTPLYIALVARDEVAIRALIACRANPVHNPSSELLLASRVLEFSAGLRPSVYDRIYMAAAQHYIVILLNSAEFTQMPKDIFMIIIKTILDLHLIARV